MRHITVLPWNDSSSVARIGCDFVDCDAARRLADLVVDGSGSGYGDGPDDVSVYVDAAVAQHLARASLDACAGVPVVEARRGGGRGVVQLIADR